MSVDQPSSSATQLEFTMGIPVSASIVAACLTLVSPAFAQPKQGAAASAPASAPLLFHGNYCGAGNRGENMPATDALDAVCRRHDLCTPTSGPPSCSCNRRLRIEAHRVAASPRQPDDVRVLAQIVAQGADLLECENRVASARVTPADARRHPR